MCDILINASIQSTPKNELVLSKELQNEINNKHMMTTKNRLKVLSTLDESLEMAVEHKRESLRIHAVEEILTSEVSYLQHIEILIEHFMVPIKSNNYLSMLDYNTIFGNIETIYNVNGELLNELKKNLDNFASAFLKMAPFLKLYSVYAYDYKKSISILQEAKRSNKDFRTFIETQEAKAEVEMKFSALLITPIQRIPRYRLLLKQVLDHTPTTFPDYKILIDSLKQVENTASHINSLVEEQENIESILKVQRSLQDGYPCIIKAGRRLLKEGILMRMSRKGNESYPRYFILMSDILMYCKLLKDDPKASNSLQCCCILPLNKCKIDEVLSKGVFKISCQDETLILYSETVNNTEQWVDVLKKSVHHYVECRKTLRKESSSRQPVRKKQITDYEQLGVSPGILRQKRRLQIGECEDIFYTKADESDDSIIENKSFFLKKVKKRPLSEHYITLQIPQKRVKFSHENELFSLTPNKSFSHKRNVPMKSSPSTSRQQNENKENIANKQNAPKSKVQHVFARIKNFVQKYFQS